MNIPRQTIGVARGMTTSRSRSGIVPQFDCWLEGLVGERTVEHCENPCAPVGDCEVCWNEVQTKTAGCNATGANCGECKDRCRKNFCSAGGWKILRQTGSSSC